MENHRKNKMESEFYLSQTFEKATILKNGDYEECIFVSCDFSNADLSKLNFVDCTFKQCDLSNAKLYGTTFRDTTFSNCKLLGMNFDDCNNALMSFSFKGCIMNYSSFSGIDIRKTHFDSCTLQEVDFTKAQMQEVVFDNCDLLGSIFLQTNLKKVDFRTAFNYSINPEDNLMNGARFSALNLSGLLDSYGIIIE